MSAHQIFAYHAEHYNMVSLTSVTVVSYIWLRHAGADKAHTTTVHIVPVLYTNLHTVLSV